MIQAGKVIWITGLSGSGKTTLAVALQQLLPGSLLLDGDAVREVLGVASSGFDRESRKNLGLTYARLCKLLATQGATVIMATISLYHEVHEWNRENLPGYLEVFLDVSEEIRRARDPKGIYAAETQGKARHVAGGETPVDMPKNPHVHISHELSVKESCKRIIEAFALAPLAE